MVINARSERQRLPTDVLIDFERALSAEKGGFYLFAIVRRADAPQFQDLVVSAPWLKPGSLDDLRFIISRAQLVFTPDQMAILSAVHILDKDAPFVTAMNQVFAIEHAFNFLSNMQPFGHVTVKAAMIVTSKGKS